MYRIAATQIAAGLATLTTVALVIPAPHPPKVTKPLAPPTTVQVVAAQATATANRIVAPVVRTTSATAEALAANAQSLATDSASLAGNTAKRTLQHLGAAMTSHVDAALSTGRPDTSCLLATPLGDLSANRALACAN